MKFDVSKGETVEYAGRAVVALMTDKNLIQKAGKTITTADLGSEFGFKDADGKYFYRNFVDSCTSAP